MLKLFSRENLESFVIAIIIVLLVRFFCLEPFKIPSSSMEPTLIGDPSCGDQILVNKFIYHFHKPKRWEVVVFKYPLDSKRNFIKRLIGLPGEEVTIKNGNIYIAGRIARKPPAVQQVLLYPIFLGQKGEESHRKLWRVEGDTWVWTPEGPLLKTANEGWCVYNQEITNEYIPHYDKFFLRRSRPLRSVGGGYTVGEFLLKFSLQVHSGKGAALVQLRKGCDRFRLRLTSPQSTLPSVLLWYQSENPAPRRVVPLNFQAQAGTKYAVAISNIDDLVTVEIAGKTVVSLECVQPLEKVPNSTHEAGVRLGGSDGIFQFSEISLWRDIYYLGRRDVFAEASTWQVPQHSYFVLGDNAPYSNDSRDWKVSRLVLQNGIGVERDQQGTVSEDENGYCFVDVYGVQRTIAKAETKDTTSPIELPFVPEHYLVGRAFSVFWPPPRVKIIR